MHEKWRPTKSQDFAGEEREFKLIDQVQRADRG